MNEVTHLEIPGISAADYQISKKKDHVEIQVSGLDPKSTESLKRYSDQYVKKITVSRNSSLSRDIIKIYTVDKNLQIFDYLTDAPSALSLDFYVEDETDKLAGEEKEDGPRDESLKGDKKLPEPARAIASAEFIKQIQNVSLLTELEEIKKNSTPGAPAPKERDILKIIKLPLDPFDVESVKFSKNAIIENRGKIYIRFPSLLNEDEYLSQLLSQKIEYEFDNHGDQETKDFVKSRKLFSKTDYKNFLRAKRIFSKKYPRSRYSEMINYMEAEAYFALYKSEGSEVLFDQALRMYDALINKYPKSAMTERTLLLVSYLRMKQGKYLDAIRNLKTYSERYKQSPLVPNIQLILAQGLLRIQEYRESLQIYEKLLTSESADVREKTHFDVGDVFFEKKDYAKALKYYEQALEKFPNSESKFPNVSFNRAEAQFLTEKYKEALASYKKFIDLFPQHEYAAYAWTRMGEVLEIAAVDPKISRGYYNESYFRFQNTNGGRVARLNLLAQQAQDLDISKFPMIIEEMHSFKTKLTLPHADEFLAVKISDTYFDKGMHKRATQELTDYFKRVKIPAYEDKFLKRIGRGISFQIRDQLENKQTEKAFSIFDEYDDLWFTKSKRLDFNYLEGVGFEQAGLYKKAADSYGEFISKYEKLPTLNDVLAFEQLPEIDSIYLRYARVLSRSQQQAAADEYLKKISLPKLKTEEQDEYYEIASHLSDEKRDVKGAMAALSSVKNKNFELMKYELGLLETDQQYQQGISLIDDYLDKNKLDKRERFEILRKKLAFLEALKDDAKYFDFSKRFYDEFKGNNYDFDREKYKLGMHVAEQGKIKEADEIFSRIDSKSYWSKLTKEYKNEQKWNEQYQKYISRIPAMASEQEKAK